MKFNLGKVTCTPRGEYNAETEYRRLDIVSYNGGSFLVIAESITGITPAAGEDYMQIAEQGETPEKGVDYFTEADKSEIVTSVIEALPTWTGGAY